MGKTIYIESTAGISGDMFVAALLDLGADEEKLKKALESLPLSGYSVAVTRKNKNGIDVCDFDVRLDDAHANHDHDMGYLYGHLEGENGHEAHGDHGHGHEQGEHSHEHGFEGHFHEGGHEHSHGEHGHEHGEHSHEHGSKEHFHEGGHEHSHGDHSHHAHRGLKEVADIINAGDLTDGARNLALKIFDILAEAEAKAHNATKETVHFHEVGAVDSIVDITAAAVCFDDLGITRVILPQLVEGRGTVRCAHGILPVPVPAVSAILSAHPIPLKIAERNGELVTPTGAAIATAVVTDTKLPELFSLKRTGIGGGKREYEVPSLLRIMEIEEAEDGRDRAGAEAQGGFGTAVWETDRGEVGVGVPEMRADGEDTVIKLETDIDDCPGEALGYLMELLYEAGAREVHYMPIYMKKNRPGVELVVICDEAKVTLIENIIFAETTTIGIRKTPMQRRVLERQEEHVETPYGIITVKTVTLPDGTKRSYPEYESMKRAAQSFGVPLETVRAAATEKKSGIKIRYRAH